MTTAAAFWDVAEPFALCEDQGLFLCPLAKIIIHVRLPKILVPGQTISNWDLMERLKKAVNPIQLFSVNVTDSTLESVTFHAELISNPMMNQALKILNSFHMKVSGFSEPFTVAADEAESHFPNPVDWEKYFLNRGNKDVPGLRADTIYLSNIPIKWFSDGSELPSQELLAKALSRFGSIRNIDIPICEENRILFPSNISGIKSKKFSYDQDLIFECYIQYENCEDFKNAMLGLKNMKWFKKIGDKVYQTNVKVEFDRSFHLSSQSIKARSQQRERIMREQMKKEEEEHKEKEEKKQRLIRELEEKERRLKKELEEKEQLQKELDQKIQEELERQKKGNERKAYKNEEEYVLLQKEQFDEGSQHLSTQTGNTKKQKSSTDDESNLEKNIDNADMGNDLDTTEKEEKLRKLLLLQQEHRMREMLKKKLVNSKNHSRNCSDPSSDSDDDRKHRKRRKKSSKHKDRR